MMERGQKVQAVSEACGQIFTSQDGIAQLEVAESLPDQNTQMIRLIEYFILLREPPVDKD